MPGLRFPGYRGVPGLCEYRRRESWEDWLLTEGLDPPWLLGGALQGEAPVLASESRGTPAAVAQWAEHLPQTKRPPVQSLVWAHAWVVGQVPGWGHARGR